MVDPNMTSTEEVEMLKRWWNSYGKAIAIAVVIGLLVGFGWRYWNQYKTKQAAQASVLYQSMTIADYQKKVPLAEKFAGQLMSQYHRSPYATMAALWWAKEAIQQKKLPLALQKYEWVLKHGKLASLKQIAGIRAARVLLAQKKPKEALAMLDEVSDKTFKPLIDSVKGDVYTAMGNAKAARKAYAAAKTGMSSAINTSDPLLEMKLAQPVQ